MKFLFYTFKYHTFNLVMHPLDLLLQLKLNITFTGSFIGVPGYTPFQIEVYKWFHISAILHNDFEITFSWKQLSVLIYITHSTAQRAIKPRKIKGKIKKRVRTHKISEKINI